MTSQNLYATLKFFDELDSRLKLQTTLEAIQAALTNLVNQPAQPQYQTQLATALSSFESAANKLAVSVTPSQNVGIASMGGADFFAPDIAERVKNSIQTNAMTPSVARDFVQDLATKRAEFLATVRAARQALEKLGIKASTLQPGAADLAFLIPRDIFDNHLAAFAKELGFISRLMQDFSEAITGQPEQVELEELSSSVPTVALAASVGVISVIATIVNKFIDAWKKIEEIRQMRAKLTEMGLRKAALEELTEEITVTVNQVVEEATELVLVKYPGSPERKNELANAIRQDTHRLFGQIERGLTVEFRTTATKEKDESEGGKALANISNLASTMQFPDIAREPMLLTGEELLDGDIKLLKHTKKTATEKTTTSKKTVPKDVKPEAKE
jgi:hypothetical protein